MISRPDQPAQELLCCLNPWGVCADAARESDGLSGGLVVDVVVNTSQDQQASAEQGWPIAVGFALRLAVNPVTWVIAVGGQSGGPLCMRIRRIPPPPNSSL